MSGAATLIKGGRQRNEVQQPEREETTWDARERLRGALPSTSDEAVRQMNTRRPPYQCGKQGYLVSHDNAGRSGQTTRNPGWCHRHPGWCHRQCLCVYRKSSRDACNKHEVSTVLGAGEELVAMMDVCILPSSPGDETDPERFFDSFTILTPPPSRPQPITMITPPLLFSLWINLCQRTFDQDRKYLYIIYNFI